MNTTTREETAALTPAKSLAQLCSPPTPHFEKLEAFAKQWNAQAHEDEEDGYETDAAGNFKG